GESTWNVTGKLTWNATDELQFNVKAEYTETDDEHYASLFQPDLACYNPGGPACQITASGLRAVMNIADLREGATSGAFGTSEGEEFFPSVALPAPFIGTRSETRRYLAEGIYTVNDWEISARATLNHQSLESYKDLDRSPYFGPLFAGVFHT